MPTPRCSAAIVWLLSLLIAGASAQEPTMDDVRSRLSSEFHESLYRSTYQSLLQRIEPSGYLEESLTGAYSGMFPRTVGGMVSLLLETGELEKAQLLVGYVLRAMELNGMERVAHVLGREYSGLEPVAGGIVQPEHPIALYRLDQPDRFGGAQEFTAPTAAVQAIELWLTGHQCRGTLALELATDLQAEPLVTLTADAAALSPSGSWIRFSPALPPPLEPSKQYVMRCHFVGEGVPAWWGLAEAGSRPLGAGHGRDTQLSPEWMSHPGHVAAFAIDDGSLRRETRGGIPVLCDRDQIDGQAHVILAWARLALKRGHTEFEDETYETVAKLMDRSSDWPYVTPQHPPHPMLLIDTGLVRNACFEHSRDGRFWDVWDLLTQSFVSAALTDMLSIAQRRGDELHAGRWKTRLGALQRAIATNMTRELSGERVYLEMRLPDGGGGVPFGGLGWVNLSPIAAQWEGVDREVLRHTMAAYRERAMFPFDGNQALALDWWPERPLDKSIIGKAQGWEMVYCLQEGDAAGICRILDCIEAVNSAPIFMEAASLGGDGKWRCGDPGNGEQCSWYCWGMSKVRQAVGLAAR